MSIFDSTTEAPLPKTRDAKRIALFYAGVLLIMAVAQLFTFDTFLTLVTGFGFPGGVQYAHFLAAFLIVCEVFALPFLLRMRLSVAFRWVSMVFGWLAAVIWIKITVWLVVQDGVTDNVGFLGTVAPTMPGWWAIFMAIVFGILAGWASWGLWPRRSGTKEVSKRKK